MNLIFSVLHHRLLDCFAVDSAVTSLSMSPTDDFLATSHVGDLGLYLWANRALYSFVSLQPLPEGFEPSTIQMPATAERPDGEWGVGVRRGDGDGL
jgi:U3 small nucleolar RNA-associated protein 21